MAKKRRALTENREVAIDFAEARALLDDVVMLETTHDASNSPGTTEADRMFWRRLLHRWFVRYNPAYLLSAALVFRGCFLWSRGVVHDGTMTAMLGIPFVAEIYAAALIGGIALLTRIGQRRPAVMLALIVLVYQWDVTLHTEACAYLGRMGTWAAAGWLVIFVGKIHALMWALRIRISARMIAAATIAALGLVIMPASMTTMGARAPGSLLAAWVFALATLYRHGQITSVEPLDTWGDTVLRRATNAAWAISAVLIGMHVTMWCVNEEVTLAPLLFALPLVAVTRIRSEARTWALVAATLGVCVVTSPMSIFATSMLAASALVLRTLAPQFWPTRTIEPDLPVAVHVPYRAEGRVHHEPRFKTVFVPAPPLTANEVARCYAGALSLAYLGAWTIAWGGGTFPVHDPWLDLAFTLVAAFAMWRTRTRVPFALPLAVTYADLVWRARILPIPHSDGAWGELAVATGFALLGVSLAVSYRLRDLVTTSDT